MPEIDLIAEEERNPRAHVTGFTGISPERAWEVVKHYYSAQEDRLSRRFYRFHLMETFALPGAGDQVITVVTETEFNREWLSERFTLSARRLLVGILNRPLDDIGVQFITRSEP